VQPSYNLIELAKMNIKLEIEKCPRCGGYVYWLYPYTSLPQEKELSVDKIKCFSCSRMFYLAKNGNNPRWVQYPDRKEVINTVIEYTLVEQLKKKEKEKSIG